jgi:hypothetical protein
VSDSSEPRILTVEAARYCGFRSPRGLLSAFRRGKVYPVGRRGSLRSSASKRSAHRSGKHRLRCSARAARATSQSTVERFPASSSFAVFHASWFAQEEGSMWSSRSESSPEVASGGPPEAVSGGCSSVGGATWRSGCTGRAGASARSLCAAKTSRAKPRVRGPAWTTGRGATRCDSA